MNQIDADKLARAQKQWGEVKRADISQYANLTANFRFIEDFFKESGLNQWDNTSYELLEPGLSMKDFYARKCSFLTHRIMNSFLYLHFTKRDYTDSYVKEKFFALDRLYNEEIPDLCANLYTVTPEGNNIDMTDFSPQQKELFAFIIASYGRGEYKAEMQNAAQDAAHEYFRGLMLTLKNYTEEMAQQAPNMQLIERILESYKNSRKNLNEIMAKYKILETEIFYERDISGQAWTDKKVIFSAQKIAQMDEVFSNFENALASKKPQAPKP